MTAVDAGPSTAADPPADRTRADVADEHAKVRALVEQLVAEALPTARKVGHRALRERLGELRAAVERAIEVEERELVPLLATADAWGPVRVERVRERHARLLSAVRAFEDDVVADRHARADVVARTDAIVRALTSDLFEEERALAAEKESEVAAVVVPQETD